MTILYESCGCNVLEVKAGHKPEGVAGLPEPLVDGEAVEVASLAMSETFRRAVPLCLLCVSVV